MICLSKSCVRGRLYFTPASSIAMALASPGPIQIGRMRGPPSSRRMTTGAFVPRSSPRCATRTSIIASPAESGPKIPRRQVVLLLRREHVDPDAGGRQLEGRDLAVEFLRHAVHIGRERLPLLEEELRAQRLVREGHVHHAGRVALGGGEVDQPTLG